MEKLQPGQMLGPYRIISQIGQGGMATVYKAYQPSMDRNVAIKVLPGQLAESAEFTQRFQQEARIIAKLEHPHILPVFDYGENDGVTYFVMRYLDAGTLSERMKSGSPLALHEIDRLFTQLAEALSYAHSFGIIHRDLKPSNAMIDSQGNLFLTDFGIAKLLESASPRLTQTDAIMGTPAYISPEQAQAGKVDQRSDIYSLGIILYEMVTGRVPFVAETPLAVILKHVSDPLPPPSSIKSDVPDPIERVVLKALAKHPEDRYGTVAEFLSAWKRALDDVKSTRRAPETVVAQTPPARMPVAQTYPTPATDIRQTATATLTQPKSRGWAGWAVGCLIGLCVLVVVGGGGFYLLNQTADETPTEAFLPPPTDEAPITDVPTDLPEPTATVVIPDLGDTLFEDDFSDNSDWGIGTDSESSVEYDGESLRMQVFIDNYIVWSTPSEDTFEDVHVEVTVNTNGSDPLTAFAIICDLQEDDEFYYLAFTLDGQYAIAQKVLGSDSNYLTASRGWEVSDDIPLNADSYRLGADCGNGRLTLYVDGQEIDSVTDSTYSSGYVGLMLWSDENVDRVDANYDDFVVTELIQ